MMNRSRLSPADDVLYAVLRMAKRPYAAYWLAEHRKHPHYPSFTSLTYVFRKVFLNFFPAQLSYDELREVPFPLIAHIDEKDGFFVMVLQAGESEVKVSVRGREKTMTKEEFEKIWDGAVLLLDTEPLSAEGPETENPFLTQESVRWKKQRLSRKTVLFFAARYRMRILGMLFLLLLVLLAFAVPARDGFNVFFTGCALSGLAVSLLLSEYRLHREHSRALRVCNLFRSKKVDCASVLDSRYAGIGGWFSWADAGVVYFLSASVALLAFPVPFSNRIVSVCSLLSLPVVLWLFAVLSIKIRRFCLLCCIVQGLLVVSAIAGGFYLYRCSPSPDVLRLLPVFVAVVPCMAVLYFVLLRAWREESRKDKLLAWYNYSRHTPAFLSEHLYSLPLTDFSGVNFLELNPGKKHRITMIFNPLCSACTETLAVVLSFFPEKENTTLALLLLADFPPAVQEAKKICAAYRRLPEAAFFDFLSCYVRGKPFRNHPAVCPSADFSDDELLRNASEWCRKHGIASVPRLYYCDRALPREYAVKDLDYLCR